LSPESVRTYLESPTSKIKGKLHATRKSLFFKANTTTNNSQSNSVKLNTVLQAGVSEQQQQQTTIRTRPVAFVDTSHLFLALHCSMANFASNCWFNAAIQSLCYSDIITKFLECSVTFCWNDLKSLFLFMRNTPISQSLQRKHCSNTIISKALSIEMPAINHAPVADRSSGDGAMAVECSDEHERQVVDRFPLRNMHDSIDFIRDVFRHMFTALKNELIFTQTTYCTQCGFSYSVSLTEPLLSLAVPAQKNVVYVQDLLQTYFSEIMLTDSRCDECKGMVRKQKVDIPAPPQTFLINLKRIGHINGRLRKCLTPVRPTLHIQIGKHKYRLRSAIVHDGAAINSGHFYTIVVHNDGQRQYYVECNDKRVIRHDALLDKWESNYVLFVYDKATYNDRMLNLVVDILQCFSVTSTIRDLQCMNVGEGSVRRNQVLFYSKYDTLRHEAAMELCSQLWEHKTQAFCYLKCSQLIADCVTYVFDHSSNCVIMAYGVCSQCLCSQSMLYSKSVCKYAVRSLTFPLIMFMTI
jgi:hypothetical protein